MFGRNTGPGHENGYAFRKADHNAIRNYYGFRAKDIGDYVRAAQLANADNYRAMFEAAGSRMWDITSGVMIWKLNASYPDFAWEMYDWFLNPNAGYYFAKKACEPLHIQMNANDRNVVVINTLRRPINNAVVEVKVYDSNLKLLWEHNAEINVGADRYQVILGVPQQTKITPVYFVRLQLKSQTGEVLSSNLYWESSANPQGWSTISNLGDVERAKSYWDSSATSPAFSDLSKLENVALDVIVHGQRNKRRILGNGNSKESITKAVDNEPPCGGKKER